MKSLTYTFLSKLLLVPKGVNKPFFPPKNRRQQSKDTDLYTDLKNPKPKIQLVPTSSDAQRKITFILKPGQKIRNSVPVRQL